MYMHCQSKMPKIYDFLNLLFDIIAQRTDFKAEIGSLCILTIKFLCANCSKIRLFNYFAEFWTYYRHINHSDS